MKPAAKKKKKKVKPQKPWGWLYITEGEPCTITYRDRQVVELRTSRDVLVGEDNVNRQRRAVLAIIRALNKHGVRL